MATKTYILAPNFTYKPTGPIQIGSIIADPFRPAKSLSQPAVEPAVETVTQYNHEATRQIGRSFKLSFWAHVAEAAGGGVGASRDRNATDSLSIERLQTRYLAQEPSDNDPNLAMRLKEPDVRAAIRSGLYGRAPVYLISGVKIARGLVVRSETGRIIGGSVTTTAPVAQAIGVDVGAGAETESSRGITSSFVGGDEDIIIAYQLHIVKPRRSKGRFTSDVFESDAAFLHGDEMTVEEDRMEISVGDASILGEAAEEMDMVIESEDIETTDGDRIVYVQAMEV